MAEPEKKFGAELNRLRKAKGMTWKELGSKAGYAGTYLQRIAAEISPLSRHALLCVAGALELSNSDAQRLHKLWMDGPRRKSLEPANGGDGSYGGRVRNARAALRMSQAELAKESGVPQHIISLVERGAIPEDMTRRLEAALKMSR